MNVTRRTTGRCSVVLDSLPLTIESIVLGTVEGGAFRARKSSLERLSESRRAQLGSKPLRGTQECSRRKHCVGVGDQLVVELFLVSDDRECRMLPWPQCSGANAKKITASHHVDRVHFAIQTLESYDSHDVTRAAGDWSAIVLVRLGCIGVFIME